MRSRRDYLLALAAASLCYAALGAVLRILPGLVGSKAALGLAVGAPSLAALLTRPAGGRLADGVGPRRVVGLGALVMALGVAPALLAIHSAGALIASRLVVGAGEGAMMAATVLWLLRLAGDEHRGRALGHIGLANYAGLAAGPLLADALGAETPVLVAAAVLPLAGAALVAALRPPPAPPPERRVGTGGLARLILRPGLGLALVNVGFVAVLAYGTGVARAHGVAAAALIVPVFALGVILARTAGAGIPDRFGGRRTLYPCAALAAGGLVTLTAAHGSAVAIAGVAVLACGQALAVPSLGLLALARVPAARHGAAAGLFFAFFDAGVGGGGLLAGAAAKVVGSSGALLFAAGAVALAAPVGGGLALGGDRERRAVPAHALVDGERG